jgi:hypothetical protein
MSDAPNAAETPKIFERVFDSKIVRVAISVGAFFTAAVLLGFKDEITKSWPLAAWPGFNGQFALAAAVYWSASVLLLAVGICQYIAADQKTARTERKRKAEKAGLDEKLASLTQQLENVKNELETLPGGPSFREQFALRADDLQLLLTTALAGSSDPAALESGLRLLIAGMAHLASLYGPTGANACYAYAMRFVAQPSAAECALVHMVPGDGHFDPGNGLLLAVTELAAKMNGEKDTRIQPFALATVPSDNVDSLPRVFATQAVFARKDIAGVAEVLSYLDSTSETSPEVARFAAAYKVHPWAFGQSFISLPLCVHSGAQRRDRIGVVTITSDGPKIMGGVEERWEIFWMIMRPYTDGIAVLFELLLKLRKML